LNRKGEAEDILHALKAREYELSERHRDIVNFNLGTYDLARGNFLEGLEGFMLKGKKLKLWFSHRELPYKFWSGGAYPGKTLILFAEGGGIGDEMLSIRFIDDLKKIGFNPVFYTSRPDMHRLFNRCGYSTIMDLEGIPADAMWTYFMQVPIYLRSTVESVKRSKYLYPPAARRAEWQEFFPDTLTAEGKRVIRVGVRWQGNAKNERDLHRQVPLDGIMKTLHGVFDDAGVEVEYVSLQIGDGAELADKYPELIDLTGEIKSYDDTLAILERMDYVITSCTSVLHASAIVGTKTLALIPISAYFTWVSPTPDNTSVWYDDNLRLFHQVTPKCWDEPFEEMAAWLRWDMLG